jgi:RNA polymerase sigma-70 factor (ECF subfamily)
MEAIREEELEPDEAQWVARRQHAVRAAVDALPERLRRALSLAFLEDLTHEQVAAALGTPLGTTKTRIRKALKQLAPVLAAVIAVIIVVAVWRRAAREERALVMVTSSDVAPRRLDAAPGVPSQAHGQFRARPGSSIAVLTTAKLPRLARGERYVVWVRHAALWTRLGFIERGEEDRALLVGDDENLAGSPDDVRVTRETHVSHEPTGTVVLSWSK